MFIHIFVDFFLGLFLVIAKVNPLFFTQITSWITVSNRQCENFWIILRVYAHMYICIHRFIFLRGTIQFMEWISHKYILSFCHKFSASFWFSDRATIELKSMPMLYNCHSSKWLLLNTCIGIEVHNHIRIWGWFKCSLGSSMNNS